MNDLYVDTSDIKQFLPLAIRNRGDLRIPVLSKTTICLFQEIYPVGKPLLQKIQPLNKHVTDLQSIAKALQDGKKCEKLHKVLSIFLLATYIAGVVMTFLFPPVSHVIGIAACSAFGGSYVFCYGALEKLRTEKDHMPSEAVPIAALISFGLVFSLHYLWAAFGRRRYLENELTEKVQLVEHDEQKMKAYIAESYGKLHNVINSDLESYEKAFKNLKKLNNPLRREEKVLQTKITEHQRALAELDVINKYYEIVLQ